jgi:hypothetical protein
VGPKAAADRTVAQPDSAPDLVGLGVQGGPEGGAHIGIGFDREHLVAGPGQPDGLRSLAGTHIQDPGRTLGQVPVQLARDHLLPDHVADVAEPAKPGRPPGPEGTVASGVAARRVPGTYHRANATSATATAGGSTSATGLGRPECLAWRERISRVCCSRKG